MAWVNSSPDTHETDDQPKAGRLEQVIPPPSRRDYDDDDAYWERNPDKWDDNWEYHGPDGG